MVFPPIMNIEIRRADRELLFKAIAVGSFEGTRAALIFMDKNYDTMRQRYTHKSHSLFSGWTLICLIPFQFCIDAKCRRCHRSTYYVHGIEWFGKLFSLFLSREWRARQSVGHDLEYKFLFCSCTNSPRTTRVNSTIKWNWPWREPKQRLRWTKIGWRQIRMAFLLGWSLTLRQGRVQLHWRLIWWWLLPQLC